MKVEYRAGYGGKKYPLHMEYSNILRYGVGGTDGVL